MRDRDDRSLQDNILRDPRRDPTDPPPAPDAPEVRLLIPETAPAPEPKEEEPEPPAPSSRRHPERREMPKPAEGSSVVTSLDPRIAELEPLVATGDWEAVRKLLGSTEDAGKLPPNLGLIYALAHKESGGDKTPGKSETSDPYDPNLVAIRCMAGVCGLPADSPIAVVLGKRITRSNPVAWQKKKAPPAPISILIVALGLLLGAGIGWLLSFGYVTFKLPTLPFLP